MGSDPLLLEQHADLPIIILVVVGVCMVLWIVTRRRAGSSSGPRRPRSSPPAARPAESRAGRQELQQSMQELLLQLEELSREINSQVDTRLRALNLLVQEADEKIRRLRELRGDAGDDDGPPSRHLPPPKAEPHPEAADERYAGVYRLADAGRSVVDIAREMEMMTGEVELILALRRTASGAAEDHA